MDTVRLVVVDDSETALAEYRRLCSEIAGAEIVATAGNGAEAIREVKRTEPDLVLLDIVMPDIDGMVALRMLRGGMPQLPVVVVSSLGREHAKGQEALRLGARNVVGKPVSRETLQQLFASIRGERMSA